MINYNIDYQDSNYILILSSKAKSGCASYFMGIIGVMIFLMPILVIFFVFKGIDFGSTLVLLLAMLVSGYLIRLCLWNLYGKEFFIISNNKFERYNDYKFFKDNHKVYNFQRMDVFIVIDNAAVYIDELNIQSRISKDQVSAIGFHLDEEFVISHQELLVSDILKISKNIGSINQ